MIEHLHLHGCLATAVRNPLKVKWGTLGALEKNRVRARELCNCVDDLIFLTHKRTLVFCYDGAIFINRFFFFFFQLSVSVCHKEIERLPFYQSHTCCWVRVVWMLRRKFRMKCSLVCISVLLFLFLFNLFFFSVNKKREKEKKKGRNGFIELESVACNRDDDDVIRKIHEKNEYLCIQLHHIHYARMYI